MQSNHPATASGMTLAGGMSPWLQPAPAGPAVTAVFDAGVRQSVRQVVCIASAQFALRGQSNFRFV